MAARDRNLFAWQAYVIAMSFVVVGLLVALGFSIASSSNTQKSMTDAVNQAKAANDTMRKLNGEVEYIKGMLGQRQFTEAEWKQMRESAPSDPQFAALQAQYEKDMSLFGPSEPIQNKNYPKLAEYLMRELRARNAQVDSAAKAYAELTKKTENTVKSETAGREAAERKAPIWKSGWLKNASIFRRNSTKIKRPSRKSTRRFKIISPNSLRKRRTWMPL